jgi:hypothetical protein
LNLVGSLIWTNFVIPMISYPAVGVRLIPRTRRVTELGYFAVISVSDVMENQ